MSTQAGILYVVATPIGNREDMSRRAERVLDEVDCIFCEDTRHSGRLLAELGINTPRFSLHEHNERMRIDAVLQRLLAGESCALISDAGTPLINDPGFALVRAVRDAGVRVVPVPGAAAVIAALSAAGLPTDRFGYEGFLPAKAKARRERLAALAGDPRTLVFYEAPHRLKEMLADAAMAFGAVRPACVAREITKLHEEFRDGSLEELCAWADREPNAARGEIVVVIGGASGEAAAARRLNTDEVLRALLEELPASKAAKVASKLTGEKRQLLYQRALELSGETPA
ncbi:MAG TPA: 16S rRNA (cytidine(1402)-2'-O)-methyltransferase [Gammaproteobacteria bacterium]